MDEDDKYIMVFGLALLCVQVVRGLDTQEIRAAYTLLRNLGTDST